MHKVMMMVAATMSFAVFAQDPAVPAPAGEASGVERQAKRHMRPPMMMGQGAMDPLFRAVMNPRVADQLALSDEQKAKLAALKGDMKSNRDLQAKIAAGNERQVKLLEAEKIDEAAVMQAIDEVYEARKEIAKAQTKRIIAVRSILTPEQSAKALEAMKSLRGGPRAHGEGPKGRGPKARGEETPKCQGPECKVNPEK